MKNIQNTLGAMAIFAGILAGSTFAEETQTAKSNTQTATATAVGNTAPDGEKVKVQQTSLKVSKFDVSNLVFPKDVKVLTDKATELGLKFEAIDNEKKFKELQQQIEINQMAENVSEEEIEKFKEELESVELTKEGLEAFMKKLAESGVVVNFDFGEEPSKLKFRTCKKRITCILLDLDIAKLKERGRIARANTEKNNAEAAANNAEAAANNAEAARISKEVREKLANLAKGINDSKESEKDINKK